MFFCVHRITFLGYHSCGTICCQLRTTWARWEGELGLHKDLLHALFSSIIELVDLLKLINLDSVGDHVQCIQGTILKLLQQILPIQLYWCLSIADEANTALHQGTDVEVVGLSIVSMCTPSYMYLSLTYPT